MSGFDQIVRNEVRPSYVGHFPLGFFSRGQEHRFAARPSAGFYIIENIANYPR